jgi:hypothetical protein
MFTNDYQGHFQTNGGLVLSPSDRIKTNGYTGSVYGENVFSYANSVFQGHAAFAVVWGNAPGGMQTPPGHRDNMLSSQFREVGVGVVDGLNGTVGPQLVTQDFGTQVSAVPLITGVVYFDFNGNGFYDVGEGIGGVTVNTPGSSFFTVTADSGGYTLPVPGNGNYTLTFTSSGLSNQIVAVVSGLKNIKVDYSPAYTAPAISGPNAAALNQNNTYTFSGVAGATGYQWQQAKLAPYTLVEGAENGLSNVTVSVSPGYSVVSTDFAASGTHSFNLAHTDPVDQSIELKAQVLVAANSTLSFADRLGFALSNEVAKAQVSTDGGTTWQTVWSEAGNDGNTAVDNGFVNRSISLNAYAGQFLEARFVYAYAGGLHFSSGTEVGFVLGQHCHHGRSATPGHRGQRGSVRPIVQFRSGESYQLPAGCAGSNQQPDAAVGSPSSCERHDRNGPARNPNRPSARGVGDAGANRFYRGQLPFRNDATIISSRRCHRGMDAG